MKKTETMIQSTAPNRTDQFHSALQRTLIALIAATVIAIAPATSNAAAWQEAPPVQDEIRGKSKDLSKDKAAEAQEEEKTEEKKPSESESKGKDQSANATDSKTEERPARRRRRQSRSAANSRGAESLLRIFQPIIADTAKATVKIKRDDKVIALGAIVDASGFVLTKQSELRSPLTCELNDGRSVPAYVYGVHEPTDLALLKIEASDLPIIQWASDDTLEVGHWLATVKDKSTPLGVGVVGVKARLIKPQSGVMGVGLFQADQGVRITTVTEDSPAQKGGLRRGDIVQKVNGESFLMQPDLIQKIKSFPPGEKVRLTVRRKDKEIIIDVVLGEERKLNPNFQRSNQQNTMGGNELSARRQNFPLAVQHDTFLKPADCGGPVVNIEGKVVGFNIARQGRVASLMLPAALARSIVDQLKSGQLAPAVVNKSRIDEINRYLQELNTKVALSPMNDAEFKKRATSLAKEEKKLRSQLEEVLKKRIRAEVEFEQASENFESSNKEIERLKQELESLVTGSK